jgi:endonuclease III
MADDNIKGVDNDNVVKGPWKRSKVVSQSQTDKLEQDMMFSDDVAETVMIPMIHNLAENGIDIKTSGFLQEVGFMNEVIKSMMYRHLGYKHPMQLFIQTMMSTKTESIEDVYATFDHEKLEEMIKKIKDVSEIDKDDD